MGVSYSTSLDDKETAFTLRPIVDVLTNQILQEFRFADAGAAVNVEMLVASSTG